MSIIQRKLKADLILINGIAVIAYVFLFLQLDLTAVSLTSISGPQVLKSVEPSVERKKLAVDVKLVQMRGSHTCVAKQILFSGVTNRPLLRASSLI